MNILEDLYLENVQDNLISKLSGGEKKRTSIGIALVSQPSILFFDEPTSGLDATSSRNIIQIIQKLAVHYQKLVILTIHQPSLEIFQLFNTLILMSKGNVLYQGEAKKVETFFKEKGYEKGEFMSTPEYILDICGHNSRNNNIDLLNKEYDILGVKNIIIDEQLLKKKNDMYMNLSPSVPHIYYMLKRLLLLRSKNKWKLFKSFLMKLLFPLLTIFIYHIIIKTTENFKLDEDIIIASDIRSYFNIKYTKEEINENFKKASFIYKSILIAILHMFCIKYIMFGSVHAFYEDYIAAKTEILNHNYSSLSFYIYMYILEVFSLTFFNLILMFIYRFFSHQLNIIMLLTLIATPVVVIPFGFFIASIIPNRDLLPFISPLLGILSMIPSSLVTSVAQEIFILVKEHEKLKFISYLFYFYILISPTYLSDFIGYLKSRNNYYTIENDVEYKCFGFLEGFNVSPKTVGYFVVISMNIYLFLGLLITAYRQSPDIRMKTEKIIKKIKVF